jgi:hypothetical protein
VSTEQQTKLLRLARSYAGAFSSEMSTRAEALSSYVDLLVAAAVAAETERCAKMCEKIDEIGVEGRGYVRNNADALDCAIALRASSLDTLPSEVTS